MTWTRAAQRSTGDRTTLPSIRKRGNAYVRRLLVRDARSCVMPMDRTRNRLGAWLDQLGQRVHVNPLTVALASKIARIAWEMITTPGALYYQRNDPRFAL